MGKTHVLTSARSRGETMSRGNNGGKGVAGMDALSWLSIVKVGQHGHLGGQHGGGERRGSSSGPPTPGERESVSGDLSRVTSRSRQVSGTDLAGMGEGGQGLKRGRSSGSRMRTEMKEEKKEGEGNHAQSLQDELRCVFGISVVRDVLNCVSRITSVMTKLASPKIKLEKVCFLSPTC